jgi:segregation and condensation protein A
MEIDVKLDAFEGPLDLLLHLIEKNKVNIYDIPIAEITEQYLMYLAEIPEEDMDRASEFLVMAATLINIKSKMLLPPEVNEEGEEIDPREELVQQLLEYKMYRYIADELRGRQMDAGYVMYKDPSIPKELLSYREPPDVDKLFAGVELEDLHSIFERLMKQQVQRLDPVRSRFGKIEKESVTLPDKLDKLKKYARKHKRFSFRKLMEDTETKMDIIITFMAVLEMMKHGSIVVRQDHAFDDIEIESKLTEEDGGEDREENPVLEEEKQSFTENEKIENVTEKAEEDGRE